MPSKSADLDYYRFLVTENATIGSVLEVIIGGITHIEFTLRKEFYYMILRQKNGKCWMDMIMMLDLETNELQACNMEGPVEDLGGAVAFSMDNSVRSGTVTKGYLRESCNIDIPLELIATDEINCSFNKLNRL